MNEVEVYCVLQLYLFSSNNYKCSSLMFHVSKLEKVWIHQVSVDLKKRKYQMVGKA